MAASIKMRIEWLVDKLLSQLQEECDEVLEAPEGNLRSDEQRLHKDLRPELNAVLSKRASSSPMKC